LVIVPSAPSQGTDREPLTDGKREQPLPEPGRATRCLR